MADLIIKPSTGNSLVFQDEGGDPAITVATSGATTFAENATLSGTANALGTVTSGTLGSAIVFNAAHKDVDPSADGWELYMATDVNQSGVTSVIDFDDPRRLGSNITESGGVITVATAGWYFMSFTLTVSGTQDQTVNSCIRKNGVADSDKIGHRLYLSVNSNGGSYRGKTNIVVAELAATNTVRVTGSGYFYGSGTSTDEMCSFSGFRLGA